MMRYEKKITVLGAVLGGLLLIWAAGLAFSPERMAARSESVRLIAGKAADAASIVISSTSDVALAKDGSLWYFMDGGAKLPAQSKRIESFLEALAAVDRLKPMARSKEAWKDFGLEEGKAKRLIVKDAAGKTMSEISVGDYGPTGAEVYLRRAGSDESFVADSSISSYLGYGRTSWLDLRVLQGVGNEGDVQSIDVRAHIALDGADKPSSDFEYAISRDQKAWKGLPSVDSVAADSLARAILSLEGQDIVAAPPTNAFAPVAARIEIALGSGGSRVIEVGAPVGEGRFYLRVAGANLVYQAGSFALKNILKTPAELAKK
jgi:hypothetical protein